jgi:hypothetical protein
VHGCGWLHIPRIKTIKKKKRRFWVRSTLSKRKIYDGDELLVDLRNDGVGLSGELRSSFKNFFRMSSEDFENLMCLVGPAVQKKNTDFRHAIGVTVRLATTLRFLATGDSYHSMMYLFKVSTQSVSLIIPQVCEALINALDVYSRLRKVE